MCYFTFTVIATNNIIDYTTESVQMTKREKKQFSIMIIEDEQDILLLYKDYLLSRGHKIVATSTTAHEILSDYDRIQPDVAIIDYKLPNNKNGIDAAIQILDKYPSAAILIVTHMRL
jgi:Response regulator containing CheY-like receiver, AAA-type ATPase, and DNA-binding domains